MTEQELRDGEAYQESPEGTAAALVFELERVTNALEVMSRNINQSNSLLPDLRSIRLTSRRLNQIHANLLWGKTHS